MDFVFFSSSLLCEHEFLGISNTEEMFRTFYFKLYLLQHTCFCLYYVWKEWYKSIHKSYRNIIGIFFISSVDLNFLLL